MAKNTYRVHITEDMVAGDWLDIELSDILNEFKAKDIIYEVGETEIVKNMDADDFIKEYGAKDLFAQIADEALIKEMIKPGEVVEMYGAEELLNEMTVDDLMVNLDQSLNKLELLQKICELLKRKE